MSTSSAIMSAGESDGNAIVLPITERKGLWSDAESGRASASPDRSQKEQVRCPMKSRGRSD